MSYERKNSKHKNNKKSFAPQKKWYVVYATVWNIFDGSIIRENQKLLIDGISAKNANYRAYDILSQVHNTESHSIELTLPIELE